MQIAALDDQAELGLLEQHHAAEYHQLVNANLDRLYWVAQPYSLADAQQRMRACLQRLADGTGLEGGIFDRSSGTRRLVGVAGLFYIQPVYQSAEIGYWIDPGAQGRGLVTRACQALLAYAFEERKLHRIELRCAAQNTRSQAVALRLGFRQEGCQRLAERVGPDWDDLLLYGLLEEEWAANA